MKAVTIQKRIEKRFYTQKGVLNSHYSEAEMFLSTGTKIYPRRWKRNGRYKNLVDNSARILEFLQGVGIDFTTGNDAARGGAEGFYIELTRKGLKQLSEYRKERSM